MCFLLRFYKGGITYNEIEQMGYPTLKLFYDYAKGEIAYQQHEAEKLNNRKR